MNTKATGKRKNQAGYWRGFYRKIRLDIGGVFICRKIRPDIGGFFIKKIRPDIGGFI